jgi:cytochrome c biogenesis protein CcmG, thiol:disulfide interchange protein DsbE
VTVAAEPAAGEVGDGARPRRSHVVLWSSLGVAVVFAVLIAVLASSKSVSQDSASSPLIGKPAPPIAGKVLTGSAQVSLSQFRSKWVLVNFSASWCIPCRQETPQLLAFSRAHAASGSAVVIGVAYDEEDLGNLRAFLQSSGATWPVVDDSQADVTYGVNGIPESYLVDPQGTVVAKYLGGVTEAEIDSFITKATIGG